MKRNTSDRLTAVRIFDGMSTGLGSVAGIFVIVLTLLVTVGVVARYVFREPIVWSLEILTYLMLGVIFLSVAYAERGDAHVRVETLLVHLPLKSRAILNIFARLLGLAYCAALTVISAQLTFTAYIQHWVSSELLAVPLWLSMWVMPVGAFVLCLQIVATICRDVVRLKQGSQPADSH